MSEVTPEGPQPVCTVCTVCTGCAQTGSLMYSHAEALAGDEADCPRPDPVLASTVLGAISAKKYHRPARYEPHGAIRPPAGLNTPQTPRHSSAATRKGEDGVGVISPASFSTASKNREAPQPPLPNGAGRATRRDSRTAQSRCKSAPPSCDY